MLYLTFNDQPSGVYSSQVTDVVHYIRENRLADIRLVAFISIRGFSSNRQKILKESPNAWVIPIIPRGSQSWFSVIVFTLLCLVTGQRQVICRNVTACRIAMSARSAGLRMKIGYDGRGAIAAEWNEYNVVSSEKLKRNIFEMEKKAVLHSDFRIAVSQKLVDHWRSAYGYSENRHVVIPCTVSSGFRPGLPAEAAITESRKKHGFTEHDIVLVYSGSTAGWQSFGILETILDQALRSSQNVKLLFLSGNDPAIEKMKVAFPGQVSNKWLKHTEVTDMLQSCDIGILFREQSVTNQVAAPTKFAEYLSAGLPVIISENLGDYSNFVRAEKCGQVINGGENLDLKRTEYKERIRLNELVLKHYTKSSQIDNYRSVITAIS